MSVMDWDINCFFNLCDSALLVVLLVVFVCRLTGFMDKSQEGRPRNQSHRGNKGNDKAFINLKPLQPLDITFCPTLLVTDSRNEVLDQFNGTIEDLARWQDLLNWEMPEATDNSLNSIMADEDKSSSRDSLTSSTEDPYS